MLDVSIRGGLVVDGTRAKPREADVGIADGRIVEIGRVGEARTEIDAEGLVVAPGFIDAHTHDDMEVHRTPSNPNKIGQGVTTVVCGSCGFSAFPHRPGAPSPDLLGSDGPWTDFSEYAATLTAQGLGPNVVCFVGYNTAARHVANGVGQRLSRLERASLRSGIQSAVEAGAIGVSTGLIYEPGRYCETDDLIEVARCVADLGGIYSTHLRDEGSGLGESVEEALLVASEANVSVQLSHLKTIGPTNWGSIGRVLDRIDRANADGLDVNFDVYPYTAGSGPIEQYFDPDRVDEERASLVQIVRCLDFPHYEGRRIVDIAHEEGVSLADPIRRIVTAPRAAESLCVIFEIDEDDMRMVLSHPRSMIGSDGIPQSGGVPHPRLLGSFPRVLGQLSREEELFDLSTAVAKMTSVPADAYALAGRGRLVEGAAADVTIFDHARVADLGSYADRRAPTGIEWVLVNGIPVVTPAGVTTERAGRVLRRQDLNQ